MESKPDQAKSNIPPKPLSNIAKGWGGKKDVPFNQNDVALLKDNFTTSTWLLIGATLQIILFSLPIRPSYALAPALLLLTYRILNNLLICSGLKRNPYMDGVIPSKHTAQYPPTSSNPNPDPASSEICVFLISARCNHPLGLFGPNYKALADHMQHLIFLLEASGPTSGFLGANSYISANDRPASNEIMIVMYFKSYEDLYRFAHEDAHRGAWNWWNGLVKDGKDGCLSIAHEVYAVPKGKWENVYVNYAASGFGEF
jgi:hypothetical protein